MIQEAEQREENREENRETVGRRDMKKKKERKCSKNTPLSSPHFIIS